MNAKAVKINETTYAYRGFEIARNYTSPNGTWTVCQTQQGWRVTPGGKAGGDWEPSIKEACRVIDYYYDNFFQLSSSGKWIVVQAVRNLQKAKKQASKTATA